MAICHNIFFVMTTTIWIQFLRASMIDIQAAVDLQTVLHVTDERYLSLVMGQCVIRHNWMNFNMSLPKVQILAKALAPAIFRIGGNEADLLIFNRTAEEVSADWFDYDNGEEVDWYDDDLDYDEVFAELRDTWTNFTMTGTTRVL